MKQLTSKQERILNFIETYIDANGQSPSLFDIKQFLGVQALSTVHQHIKALEQKGYLQKDSHSSRGITYIMNAGKFIGEFIRIPMVGTIIAGFPIDAVQEIIDYIDVRVTSKNQRKFTADKKFYALEVRGDSMIDSFIKEGDTVIVEQTTAAKPGDMVVALTRNSEATLKHYYPEGDRVRLQPANPNYPPLYFAKGEVEIQGRVVQVVREY